MFFQKTIYKVKIIDLKEIRLYKVSSKVATCVRKSFYSKISKWQKVSNQDKKIEKVQIGQNAPTPLIIDRLLKSKLLVKLEIWQKNILKTYLKNLLSTSSDNRSVVNLFDFNFDGYFRLKIINSLGNHSDCSSNTVSWTFNGNDISSSSSFFSFL